MIASVSNSSLIVNFAGNILFKKRKQTLRIARCNCQVNKLRFEGRLEKFIGQKGMHYYDSLIPGVYAGIIETFLLHFALALISWNFFWKLFKSKISKSLI